MATNEEVPDVQQENPIDVDHNEHDSTLGEDESTYTASLRSSLLQSVNENGRGYHKYRDGAYILPEDEREQERLDMQHELFMKLFDRKLIIAPLENPLHALDLGTGTGIWAIDFADEYPECQVLGIDLSPIQPAFVPPNCRFEVDDFESDWTYKQKFDLIHGRLLMSSMSDPQALFKKTFDNLAPGGIFEMQDLYMPCLSDDGSMKPDSAWQRWNDIFGSAVKKIGRDVGWVTEYKSWMEKAGFEDVKQVTYKIPINTWPKDPNLKDLGSWNLINMIEGLPGFSVRLFNKVHGMNIEDIEMLLVDVRKDLHNKRIHSYWPIYVVYGRKPR